MFFKIFYKKYLIYRCYFDYDKSVIHYNDLITNLSSSITNSKESIEINKNISKLKEKITIYNNFINTYNSLLDLYNLLSKSNNTEDSEILNDLKKEVDELNDSLIQEEFNLLFTNDDKSNVFLELQSGAGGVDAQDFTELLLLMYIRWANSKKYQVEIISETKADIAGIKSASIKIIGKNAYGYLKHEQGIHRLVRQSPFNSAGKRHTSFASITVYREIENTQENIVINPSDLKIDTFKASGSGGQHVNTTDSAIRITHIPTGTVVQSQVDRSQHRNKDIALKMLKSKLHDIKIQEQKNKEKEIHNSKSTIDFGYQIRSYILHPYKLVKDLRTNTQTSAANDVLDGKIDIFLTSMIYYSNNIIT